MEPVDCGARGRRQGLAGLVTATQAPPVWRVPEGTEGTGALRADAPIRTYHRAPLGREAGYPGGGTHAAGPGRASHSDTSAAGVEGAGGHGGHGRASRSTTPSRRLACGDLAGGRARRHPEHQRRPEHHQHPAARTLRRMRTRHSGITKTARPHWGRAAVAVALGFEPRVAVTPHSISSAAPSAARTRYLTRILYYTDPRSAQIDRAGWDQGHTTSQDHTAARNTGATSALRTVENKIK